MISQYIRGQDAINFKMQLIYSLYIENAKKHHQFDVLMLRNINLIVNNDNLAIGREI